MIEIYCDGGSRGNPGPAAYGFVVKEDGKRTGEGNGYLGIETNNFAEYTALIEALNWAKSRFSGQDIVVYMDSKLVVSQLSGLYKVKNPKIRELVFEVRHLEPDFGRIIYRHIPREQNSEADSLVNKSLDERT